MQYARIKHIVRAWPWDKYPRGRMGDILTEPKASSFNGHDKLPPANRCDATLALGPTPGGFRPAGRCAAALERAASPLAWPGEHTSLGIQSHCAQCCNCGVRSHKSLTKRCILVATRVQPCQGNAIAVECARIMKHGSCLMPRVNKVHAKQASVFKHFPAQHSRGSRMCAASRMVKALATSLSMQADHNDSSNTNLPIGRAARCVCVKRRTKCNSMSFHCWRSRATR